MPVNPHSNDPRDHLGDYVLGADGRPIVDRYGRPVPKRTSGGQRPEPQQNKPRQYMPGEGDTYQPRRVPELPERSYQPRPQRGQRPPRAAVPPPPRRPRAPRRRPRLPRLGCGGCGTLFATLLVILIALVLFADTKLSRIDAMPDDHVSNTAGTNWLIVGSDSRQGLTDEDIERLGTGGDIGTGRTDTIMLLHIPNGGKATLVSIPRDSYVEIPGHGMDKINAAFVYGGPKLLATTVENATGLRIDHYAEIGMGGLAGITDAVGGVELCPPEPMQDPLANLDVQAGCQVMDGPTALGYVRTRATAMGDLDRVQRQREFLSALMHQVVSPGVLLNPFRSIPLALRASGMFIVGTGDHVWHLARLALAMAGGVTTETVPVADFRDTEVGNVLIWDDAAAEQLFSSLR